MSLGAVLGAIVAGVVVTAIMFRIQLSYPLVTGGMPITSVWATAVVTFEATMAGAVLATLLLLLRESGLLRARSRAPLPEIPDEGVMLQVDCTDGSGEDSIRGHLIRAGAIWVGTAAQAPARDG